MFEPHRDPERAHKRSRVGDALLLGIASCAAAMEDGAFHWKVAIVLLSVAAPLWLLASRSLNQYSSDNGRGFLGDVALTLVLIAAIVGPLSILILVLPHHWASLHPGRSLIALLPTALLWRLSTVGLHLWRVRRGGDVLIVGIGPLGRLTGEDIGEGRSYRACSATYASPTSSLTPVSSPPCSAPSRTWKPTLRQRAVDEVYFASTSETMAWPSRRRSVRARRSAFRSRSPCAPTG